MPGRDAPPQQALLDRVARRAAQEEVARPEAAAGREHPMGFAEEALARVEVDDALGRLDEDGTARLPQAEVEIIVVERAVALDAMRVEALHAGFVARTRALARRPTPTGRSLQVLEEARPQDFLRTMPDRAH